jgi:hypothetical protein
LSLALPLLALAPSPLLPAAPGTKDRQTLIVVVGAPGTDEYGAEFERWAAAWEQTARKGGAHLVRLGPGAGAEGAPEAPGASSAASPSGVHEESDRERLREAIENTIEKAVASEERRSTEALWLVLIGHGTFDGRAAKFNLRGPDVSAAELAGWLEPCRRPLAVINCASASAPFINRLSAPDRVVVTATRSGYEYNYARFGGYLAEVIAAQDSDLDRDEQVSLLEAFLAASARTAEFYEREARLATEHALIDDNGDGLGTPAEWFRGIRATRRPRDGAQLDGPRANQFLLVRSARDRGMPADLRQRRDELELAIERLREEKQKLDADTYYARLEPILLELARLYESLERAAPGPSSEAGQDAVGKSPR